jgi:signal transduction histidine kinase
MSNAAKLMREKKNFTPVNGPVPNRRILVIDDEPEIGEAVRRVLCPKGVGNVTPLRRSSRRDEPAPVVEVPNEFEVVVVTTPEQAIEAVTFAMRENRPFAMGFFDVVLGAEIDGIELVKQILSVDTKMFAVFVTAYQDRSVDAIGALLGEENREKWDYINKPFSEGEILQKARNATSLWDLHRLKDWQEERLSEAHQLLMTSERQNAVAAVGRSVAHEFGNLLTHIVGNAELALEENKPEKMKQALDIILKASDTAAHVLRRFRKLHDSGEALPAHESFDVQVAVDEAVELLEFQFRKRYIRMIRSKAVPFMMMGNRHAFVQVFVNLFINSMHAMPDGGELHISTAAGSDYNQITIRDTGLGIPEKVLPHVTEALFTTKGSHGSGLGLSICKEIIEIEHGGEILIANHPKGGVEVTLRLPINDGGKPL